MVAARDLNTTHNNNVIKSNFSQPRDLSCSKSYIFLRLLYFGIHFTLELNFLSL